MNIKIYKNDEKVYFKIDEEELEFNHENINVFIDKIISNNYEEIVYEEIEDDLANYKELLQGIYREINDEDFKESLRKIEEKQKEIAETEESEE